MSLHRVASIETWERPHGSREASPAPHPRKMSFNPISAGDWAPITEATSRPIPVEQQIMSLEKSSSTKRLFQIAVACIYCFLAAGLVFGFAALKPVLVAEGVYSQYCSDQTNGLARNDHTCYEQEVRLNLMFAIAAVATNVFALPVGTVLDRYGPRATAIVGSILLAIGCAFFVAAPYAPFDCYVSAYLFLALGGPFIFISAFQLSNCFPRHSGLILALLTGAFDTSSAILLIFRLVYQKTDGSFTTSNFFAVYLIVPTFILVAQLFLMPAESYKTVGEMVAEAEEPTSSVGQSYGTDDERSNLINQERETRRTSILTEFEPLLGKSMEQQNRELEHRQNVSGVWGMLHGYSAWQQIRTPWFILMTILVVIQMTRINYFVATIRSQHTKIFGDYNKAVTINDFFDIALPVGGIIAVPFIGLLLDNLSTSLTISLLVALATTIGILGILPYMWAAYANVIFFVLYRPFYYTAVSDYAAKVFGFETFGKVYGLMVCVAGLGNFSQSGLDALTHRAFHNDPNPVNIILLASVAIVGTILVLYVWRHSKAVHRAERAQLEREAEDSEQREQLLPAATDRPGSSHSD